MVRKRSKIYKTKQKIVNKNKEYDLDSALDLLPKLSYSKFDGVVELHINLNVDPQKSGQRVRTTVLLPHSTGREKKILVFAKGDAVKEAQNAGADILGDENTIKKIEDGFLDFDIVLAHPSMMQKLTNIARILGPKGLMPNPKSGTLTENLSKAIKEVKMGKIELKTSEKEPIIHITIGKISSPKEDLLGNINTIINAVSAAKPPKVKEPFIKSVYLTPTMGPSIRLNL